MGTLKGDRPRSAGGSLYQAILLAILIVAWLLRALSLDAQSLWGDEGASLDMARKSPSGIVWDSAADVHPPLYYLFLAGWVRLAGTSETGLRSLSAFWGLVAVALTAVLGKRLFGSTVALVGAWFTAISPFLIYYSQEARMYQQMVALGLLSTYCGLRLLAASRTAERGWSSAYVGGVVSYLGASLALLYTQYFGITVLAAHQVPAFLALRRRYLLWLIPTGLIALLYWPWLERAMPTLVWRASISDAPPLGLADTISIVLRAAIAGRSFPEAPGITMPLILILTLTGTFAGIWRGQGQRTHRLVLPLSAVLPLAALTALQSRSPLHLPEMAKQAIAAVPSVWILVAAGAEAIRRRPQLPAPGPLPGRIVQLSLLVGTTSLLLPSLTAAFTNQRYWRDDYRGLARYLEQIGRPSEAILLDAPGQQLLLDYYYKSDLPRIGLPRGEPIDVEATTMELERLAATRPTLWAVFSSQRALDPQRFVERWLSQHAYKGQSEWFGGVQLVSYLSPFPSSDGILRGLPAARFGDDIELVAYHLQTREGLRLGANAFPSTRGDDTVLVGLAWQALAPVTTRHTVVLQLFNDEAGVVSQTNAEPANGANPSPSWRPRELIDDNYALSVPEGAPAGRYYVRVRLDPTYAEGSLPTMDRFAAPLRQGVLIGPIFVGDGPTAPSALVEPSALVGPAARLAAVQVTPAQLSAGSTLSLSLVWRAMGVMDRRYTVFAHVVDASGRLWAQHDGEPAGGKAPTTLWGADSLIWDQHDISLPGSLPPSAYSLAIGMYDRATGQRLAVATPDGRALGDHVLIPLPDPIGAGR